MTVIVIGNAALDTTLEVDRLPRPGESILVHAVREDLGGKGLNQAVAAARAGAQVSFCAAIGDDVAAEAIKSRLAQEGIQAGRVRQEPRPTDRTTVFVMPDAENAIATSVTNARCLTPSDIGDAVDDVGDGDALLMQGNLTMETTLAAATRAKSHGAIVILNPSPVTQDHARLWPLTDIVVVNADECATLTGASDAVSGARRILEAGVEAAVVTRGAQDVILVERASVASVEVPLVVAVDTTAAGDTFCGVFVAGVAAGLPRIDAVERAVAAAAIAVTRPGAVASIPHREELAAAANAVVRRAKTEPVASPTAGRDCS